MTPDNDPFRVFDWKIILSADEIPRVGAIGRTASRGRCRIRLVEELRQLPQGVAARGEMVRTNVAEPQLRRTVAVAERAEDGTITWTEPSITDFNSTQRIPYIV